MPVNNLTFPDRIALFLFAHQDDEFAVYQVILNEIANGNRVICAYLTDGGKGMADFRLRNRESLAVLEKLGVCCGDVHFIGCDLSIPDGRLVECLGDVAAWVKGFFNQSCSLSAIYVPAWEGGHQDHDAINALAVTLAVEHDVINVVRQFSLYTGYRCAGPLFRVFCPLPSNGEMLSMTIPWRNRLRFLRYCLSYHSQAKTWFGLFPFVALHYLIFGEQHLQAVSFERIMQRPHEGGLYYEKRQFYSWDEMSTCLSQWRLLKNSRFTVNFSNNPISGASLNQGSE